MSEAFVRRIECVPYYLLGVPAIIAGELATSLIYHAPGWLPIAGALVGR